MQPMQHQTRTVLKSEIQGEQPKQKYCPFHERKGHELTECKAFGEKSLEDKTEWMKKSGLCFRCLTAKHRANQCKEKITCDKCKSHLHQTLLHKEKESKESPPEKETKEQEGEVRSKCISICEERTGRISVAKLSSWMSSQRLNQRSQFMFMLFWMTKVTHP